MNNPAALWHLSDFTQSFCKKSVFTGLVLQV